MILKNYKIPHAFSSRIGIMKNSRRSLKFNPITAIPFTRSKLKVYKNFIKLIKIESLSFVISIIKMHFN